MLDEGKVAAFEGRDISTFDLAIMRTSQDLKEFQLTYANNLLIAMMKKRLKVWRDICLTMRFWS